MLDKFGTLILVGDLVVYPTRPGGKGPLELGDGKVTSIEESLGELTLDTGAKRLIAIKRPDRVAVRGFVASR